MVRELPRLQSEAPSPRPGPGPPYVLPAAISAGGCCISPIGCSDPKARIIHHTSSLLLTVPYFRSSWQPPTSLHPGRRKSPPSSPPSPPSLQGCHSAHGPVPFLPPLPPGDRPQELLSDSRNPSQSCYCRVCAYHGLRVLGTNSAEALPSRRSQSALHLPVYF